MDEEQRKSLLEFVRRVLTCELGAGAEPDEPDLGPSDILGGAFVTLRNRGQLRGCMGTFSAQPILAAMLRDATRRVARDPRFADRPVTLEELDGLSIEISVLGPRVRIFDASAVHVGVHGVLIRYGHHSGCFLPQVAVERGWTAEQFLSECCRMKARLPADAWRDPRAELYVFEAEHFAEGE